MEKFDKKSVIPLLIALAVGIAISWGLKRMRSGKKSALFEAKKPEKRTLRRTVDATGTLEVTDTMKISSLVSGTVQKILVEQNDQVKKGDLLAVIDNGKGDTDVRTAQASRDQAAAEYAYQKSHFRRMELLHRAQHIADDTFEQETSKLDTYKAQLDYAEANLAKYTQDLENTKIKAPDNGTVISVQVSEGTGITTAFDATVLFEIAKDLTQMNAVLDADEADIGVLKEKQKIEMTFDCYPDKVFSSSIKRISYASQSKNGTVSFKTEVEVDNSENLLRPGMTVNASVMVEEAENVLSVSGQAFNIAHSALKLVAKAIGYEVVENEKAAKGTKLVWVAKDKTFTERAIKVGMTDETYYEILSGLDPDEEVIIDVEEESKMKGIYAKFFKRF